MAAPLFVLLYLPLMRRETNYDDCYQTLNLKAGASLIQIKHRYRELARRWHPDTVSPEQREYATYQFQQITAAKEVLEAYWEQHECAPPSESRQRFEESIQRRRTQQYQRTAHAWSPSAEAQPQSSFHQSNDADASPEEWQWQQQRTPRTTTHATLLDRLFIILIAEASIGLLLWFGYHTLRDLHASVVSMQTYSANDLMFNVFFGLFVFALLILGYLTGVALIVLAFLFLFVPYEEILRMLSRRRKRPTNPFPNLSRPFPSRQK